MSDSGSDWLLPSWREVCCSGVMESFVDHLL